MLMRALSVHIAHETSGAARIRHSLRPLTTEGEKFPASLGRIASRECEAVSAVIASEAKQSMLTSLRRDGLLRFARNDEEGAASSRGEPLARNDSVGQATRHSP